MKMKQPCVTSTVHCISPAYVGIVFSAAGVSCTAMAWVIIKCTKKNTACLPVCQVIKSWKRFLRSRNKCTINCILSAQASHKTSFLTQNYSAILSNSSNDLGGDTASRSIFTCSGLGHVGQDFFPPCMHVCQQFSVWVDLWIFGIWNEIRFLTALDKVVNVCDWTFFVILQHNSVVLP